MEDAVYHQSNLANNILSHMSGLPLTYPPQDPSHTLVPISYPTIVLTVQPNPVDNVITDAVSNIPHQLLTSIQHIHKLLINMQTNQTGRGLQTINRSTLLPPNLQAENWTKTGETNKYFWTHRKCAHEVTECNNKVPNHQYTTTFSMSSFDSHMGAPDKGVQQT